MRPLTPWSPGHRGVLDPVGPGAPEVALTLSAPHSSTVSSSSTTTMRKYGVCIASFSSSPISRFLQPATRHTSVDTSCSFHGQRPTQKAEAASKLSHFILLKHAPFVRWSLYEPHAGTCSAKISVFPRIHFMNNANHFVGRDVWQRLRKRDFVPTAV